MSTPYSIIELIPHKEPMVMVGKLVQADEISAVTTFFIREDNLFCSQGFLQEPGLIENIAQTAAAWSGYIRKEKQLNTSVGYIGGIKNLQIHALPEVKTELVTTIKVSHTVFNANIVYGEVRNKKGTLFAECEMKLFEETGR